MSPARAARLLVAAAVVSAVAVCGVGSAATAGPACGSVVRSAGNGWLASRPAFPHGGPAVTRVVAVPFAPDRIYATNGVVVMRTDDAGCHWRLVLDPGLGTTALLPAPVNPPVSPPTLPGGRTTITGMAAPSSASQSSYLYVGVTTGVGTVTRPIIFVSKDAGATWSQTSQRSGLPAFGAVRDVAASSVVPTVAYAVVDGEAGVTDGAVYSSVDGGVTWKAGYAVSRSTVLDDLQVNPVVSNMLFARDGGGLLDSTDGARTFQREHNGADIASYDVAVGHGAIQMVVGHAAAKEFERSNDAGVSWQPVRSPVAAQRVAMSPIVDDVAVADAHELWVEPFGIMRFAANVTPTVGVPDQLQFSAPVGNGIGLVGVAQGEVVRTVVTALGPVRDLQHGLVPVRLLSQLLPHRFPSSLLPVRTALSLAPGAHRDVTYHLILPRTPSPIDLMFLVDTSYSTDHVLAAMRNDIARIVDNLGALGLDVRFGLGDFKDYPFEAGGGQGAGEADDYPYRLDRRIGLADPTLARAIRHLVAGGGGDIPESQLTALYQSTTGAGQRYGKHVVIRPGLQAGYRPGSLRLAVMASDAPFHHEADYLTPRWAAVVNALRAYGVHQIGLAMPAFDEHDKFLGYGSLRDERRMAADTDTLAPFGGVDCNGDLVTDVPAGAPLVCKMPYRQTSTINVGPVNAGPQTTSLDLTPAIVSAADSVPDLRSVALHFSGAKQGVARLLAPTVRPVVDIKHDNLLSFTVRYTCPSLHNSHVYRLGVDAAAGAQTLASADAVVSCGAVPVHPPTVPVAVAAAPVAAAAAPAPPGNPLPNANPNPNPALNANVGFAQQQQEQKQLAFAEADQGVEEQPDLAMSRLRSSDADHGAWTVGAAAVMFCAGAAYSLRSRLAFAWHRR